VKQCICNCCLGVTMATKEMIKPFEGEWQCDNSRTENFEEFLAEMGEIVF